jgi:hypothetical protein
MRSDVFFRTPGRSVKRACFAIACTVFAGSGCLLDEQRQIRIGTATPVRYCPGDTVIASYDIVGSEPCVSRSGFDCAELAPAITISSTPAAFPTQTFRDYSGRIAFVPTESLINVSFATDRWRVLYPMLRRDGSPDFRTRYLGNNTLPIQRLEGETQTTLRHYGGCDGPNSRHTDASLPGLPQSSDRTRTRRLCNRSTVRISATVVDLDAVTSAATLAPGECFEPLPTGLGARGGIVSVRALSVAPSSCSALENRAPPEDVVTEAHARCSD